MVSLDAMYSGTTLGRALAEDEEEFAYALIAIVEGKPDFDRVSEHLSRAERDKIACFLHQFALDLCPALDTSGHT